MEQHPELAVMVAAEMRKDLVRKVEQRRLEDAARGPRGPRWWDRFRRPAPAPAPREPVTPSDLQTA